MLPCCNLLSFLSWVNGGIVIHTEADVEATNPYQYRLLRDQDPCGAYGDVNQFDGRMPNKLTLGKGKRKCWMCGIITPQNVSWCDWLRYPLSKYFDIEEICDPPSQNQAEVCKWLFEIWPNKSRNRLHGQNWGLIKNHFLDIYFTGCDFMGCQKISESDILDPFCKGIVRKD